MVEENNKTVPSIEETEDFEMEVEEGFEIVQIDEGVYEGELVSLKKRSGIPVERDGKTELISLYVWRFRLPDGIEIEGTTSTKFTKKSKALQWASRLLQRDLEVGETLRPDQLVGKKAQVIVKNRERTIGNDKVEMSYVDDLLRLKE